MTILSESGFGGTKPWSRSKLEACLDSRGFYLYLKKLHYYHSGSASALQKHSLLCIIITQERQLAVIFEDDAEVSPHWYGAEIGNWKGAGIFHSAGQRRVTWFWHFRASDFHKTFTRSSLALNMSRKLLSDP